jgi:hypothetical protein
MAEKNTRPGDPQPDSPAKAAKATDAAAAQVQKAVDVETEQGFRGIEVDPTPNENYTLAGQNAGAPTPETDEATAKKAAEAQGDVAAKAAGVAER